MSDVLDNYSNVDFENFSPPDCSAVEKSLEIILVLRGLGRLKNVLTLYWTPETHRIERNRESKKNYVFELQIKKSSILESSVRLDLRATLALRV